MKDRGSDGDGERRAEEFAGGERSPSRRLMRREALGGLAAGAVLPLVGPAHGAALPRIAVIGGGMAGVALTWLLDGVYEVVLLEARDALGGNVQSVEVDLDGTPTIVDAGAQFFHPGPYPTYVGLLEQLGLYPPAAGESHAFPASITVGKAGEPTPRFVSPVLPGRVWPLFAPWNTPGVQAFAQAFAAAKEREEQDASWNLTLGQWLPTLGLSSEQWEGMLLPWAASLFSGDIEQARTLSARSAMIFAAKALPQNPLDPILYYVLDQGMIEALDRMVAELTTAELHTGTPVTGIERLAAGGFRIHSDIAASFDVAQVVFASSGPPTQALIAELLGAGVARAALSGIEFHDAALMLHKDATYVPDNQQLWSFLNCEIEGGFCEASMWLSGVVSATTPTQNLWKSWVTHRPTLPSEVLYEAHFKHMLPTPASLAAQAILRSRQGHAGLWFTGGYTMAYDSQETALLSALEVAEGLGATSLRVRALRAAAGG